MDPGSEEKIGISQFAPPRPMEAYPQSSIRKIAVLFTDVVGSTRYFRNLGDVAGREMLKRHQDIASSPIVEHGGVVVKTLGDSIMAYFMDPKEAIKSAVKIQQRFLRHNRQQDPENKILVRIGIHFGEGIIEDHDIFGNVVNLAAKIVPLADKNQIFVSHEVCTEVMNLPPLRYEKVAPAKEIKDIEGLDIYRIIWDESIHFDPTTNILLFLKPLWKLAGSGFKETWSRVVNSEKNRWEEKDGKLVQQEKKSIILVFNKISSAIESAQDIFRRYRNHHEKEPSAPFLPVQILIDSGPYLRADNVVLESADINWDEIHPGEIYISSSALRLVEKRNRLHTDPPFDYDHPRPMYRMIQDQQDPDILAFMYRNVLVSGRYPVCFYCGSRKHTTTDCPSKKQMTLTRSLEKLGYSSIDAINGLFLGYLNPKSYPEPTSSADAGVEDPDTFAKQCFYELKSIVQLRFFRNIWDSGKNGWDDAKTVIDSGEKGGQIWLALDLIRTSRLNKAESLLNTLMLEKSQDYKVYCTVGFHNLEQNQYSKAEYNFERALMFVKTKPQRIFILFLLSRLLEVRGNISRAEEKIEEILRIYPSCADARYQRVIYRLYKGQDKRALAELTKLIQEQREFFVKALIDPELAPFSEMINKRLQQLFQESKERADHQFPIAESEKKRLESLIGNGKSIDDEIESVWKKANEMLPSQSYFGYLDVIDSAHMITNRCRTVITDWKKKINRQLSELGGQLLAQTTFIQRYPYPFMIFGIRKRLQSIHTECKQIHGIVADEDVEKFKEAYARAVVLAEQMNKINPWLKRFDFIRKSAYLLVSFFKISLTLQTVNLLVGILLLPVISHYLVVAFPKLTSLNQNLWFYQKNCLLIGGIFAVLVAIIKPLKKLTLKS